MILQDQIHEWKYGALLFSLELQLTPSVFCGVQLALSVPLALLVRIYDNVLPLACCSLDIPFVDRHGSSRHCLDSRRYKY